jgi:hypothetical protein
MRGEFPNEIAAFRYIRILREELLEFSMLYRSDKGWIPPLSKLENCLRMLSKKNARWKPAHDLSLAIYAEKPKGWDDIKKSPSVEALIDFIRDARQRKWSP